MGVELTHSTSAKKLSLQILYPPAATDRSISERTMGVGSMVITIMAVSSMAVSSMTSAG
jgi:hypothetical protein